MHMGYSLWVTAYCISCMKYANVWNVRNLHKILYLKRRWIQVNYYIPQFHVGVMIYAYPNLGAALDNLC